MGARLKLQILNPTGLRTGTSGVWARQIVEDFDAWVGSWEAVPGRSKEYIVVDELFQLGTALVASALRRVEEIERKHGIKINDGEAAGKE